MKERIVLDFGAELKNICNGCAEGVKAKCKQTQKDHLQCALQMSELEEFEVEKYPTNWEELKELCKGIKGVEYAGGNAKGEIIEISNIWFAENGEIWGYTDDFTSICNISKDRTPQQMWQIIKSLIGEE